MWFKCVCVSVYNWLDYFKKNGDIKVKEMKEEKGVILTIHVRCEGLGLGLG